MVTIAPKSAPRHSEHHDRRKFRRVRIEQFCRMIWRGEEYPCEIVDVSEGGAAIKTGAEPKMGDTVVLYFDDMGRVRSRVVRLLEAGVAVAFTMAQIKRDRVIQRLDLLVTNGRTQSLPHERLLVELLDASNGVSLSSIRDNSILKRTLDDYLEAGWIEWTRENGTNHIRLTERGRLLGPLSR